MPDTTITLIGNLTADPELKYTKGGDAVCEFTVASTPRTKKGGEWVDGDTLFVLCKVWREHAENCAESLVKGVRVIVFGKLVQRSYETRDGNKGKSL
jgi:single-strand DNA-binding protein